MEPRTNKYEPLSTPSGLFPQDTAIRPLQQARLYRRKYSGSHDGNKAVEYTKNAIYVHQQFSAGDMSQSVEILFRDYETCAHKHSLSAHFVNILEGTEKTFLLNNQVLEMSYEGVSHMINTEYNSESLLLQVKSTLDGLKLTSFMSSHSIVDDSKGLSKLVDFIESRSLQCTPSCRSDENKIRFLRSVVIRHDWDLSSISNIVTDCYNFKSSVKALQEILQLACFLKSMHAPDFSTSFSGIK